MSPENQNNSENSEAFFEDMKQEVDNFEEEED